MRWIFTILLFLTILIPSGAQDISIRSWIDSSRIYIGDQTYYNVEILQPVDKSLNIPVKTDTLIDKIEIIETSVPDTSITGDNQLRISYRQLITSFDTGRYDIPPSYVELKNDDGIQRYYSDYALLEVLRVNIAPQDSTDVIFDIIGIRKAPLKFTEILPWILLVIFIVGMGYWIYRYFLNRKKKVDDDISELPSEPIHIIALRELDKLEKLALWQKGEVKEHYSGLTEIIRIYLDRIYHINSMEMTSSETLSALERTKFNNKELKILLSDMFLNADLSKFAKYVPDNKYNSESIEHARHFINETYRISEPRENDQSLSDNLNMEGNDE